jgi:hypothetical protein
MIIVDNSALALPGKQDEALALVKRIVAHLAEHWPAPAPRQVRVDLTGEAGRIHIVAVKASLDEHERHGAEQGADGTMGELGRQLAALTVPGSGRTVLQRIA